MKIQYQSSVKVPAGWRSVNVVATCTRVSPGMAIVESVDLIDGEKPSYGQTRTGAKRQEFNGRFWASCEVGKKKRLSACTILE